MSLAFPALIGRFFTTGATQIAPQKAHIQEKNLKKNLNSLYSSSEQELYAQALKES